MSLAKSALRTLVRRAIPSLIAGSMILAPVTVAAAEQLTEINIITFEDVVVDGCDEPISLSGSISDVFHFTINNDGGITLVESTGPMHLTGTGLDSGATYHGVGRTIFPTRFSNFPDPLVDQIAGTVVDRTRLVGTAGALTLDIRTTFHITKVATETVVIFERSSVTCK
jgi:hypothetical protein